LSPVAVPCRTAAAETGIPPIERMAEAQADLDDALAAELLARIRESDPIFFERLVLKLLVTMGYGGSEEEAAEHLGGGGDEGVDGVISEDKLGRDRIYVQARDGREIPSGGRTSRASSGRWRDAGHRRASSSPRRALQPKHGHTWRDSGSA
jgi:restriction endonuclease Mrr